MSATSPQAVVIGASAGAVEALSVILLPIPKTFRLPVFIVVHVPPDRKNVMADLFRAKCRVIRASSRVAYSSLF